jgi:hypothetical protein
MTLTQVVFEELLREFGGKAALTAVQLGACRRLAMLLGGTETIVPAQIATLQELLPARPAADDEPEWDLSLLTNEQLEDLDVLAAICTRTAPPTVVKPRRGPPRRSHREHVAIGAAHLLDHLEADADAARKAKHRHVLTDDDLMHVRNCLVELLGCVALPRRVFAIEIENSAHQGSAVSAAVLDTPPEPPGAAPVAVPAAPAPEPVSNIADFVGGFSRPRSYPGEASRPEARTGVDIPRGRW